MSFRASLLEIRAALDFRLRGEVPYFLEVNPLPGLNPESSDLVIMAKLVGWTYAQLVTAILEAAFDVAHAVIGKISGQSAHET